MRRSQIHGISADEFEVLTRRLVGLPVTHAWRGYGSALMLELGRLRQEATPKRLEAHGPPLAHKGEAGVMIEWSWRIERARSIEVGSWSSDRQIDTGIARLAGPEIVHLRVVGRIPELEISFSDGRWLRSFMTAEGQPSWTVFLQDSSWLSVARGRVIHDTQNQSRQRRSGAPAA